MLTLHGVEPPREKRGFERKISFVKPYGVGLARTLSLFAGGWATWKGRATIVEICRHFGYDYISRETPALPKVTVESLTPSSTMVQLWALDSVDGNVTDRELLTIARLVVATGAKSLFEFGTFDGRTTLNLAMNAGSDARVWTLDLPASTAGSTAAPLHPHETRYAIKDNSGARYRGTGAEKQITQLYGDSAKFDFAQFSQAVDLAFVDGSHAYSYVINDSLHAIEMVRPGGIILWHDYSRWDDVTCALNDLRRSRPDFAGVQWIEGTTLAFLRRP